MNDYETLKQYLNYSDQQVYQMIGALEPIQWEAFCEALNKLEPKFTPLEKYNPAETTLNIRRALFIARSYPMEDKQEKKSFEERVLDADILRPRG